MLTLQRRLQFCLRIRAGITVPNINEGILHYRKCSCCDCCVTRRITSYLFYSIKRILLVSSQGLALLEFFPHAILFFQSLINADIFWLDGPYSQNFLVFFILSNRNTKVWSKEISMSPYVAKMFFVQVDEDFWLCWCVWYKNI